MSNKHTDEPLPIIIADLVDDYLSQQISTEADPEKLQKLKSRRLYTGMFKSGFKEAVSRHR